MCGIAGIISSNHNTITQDTLTSMTDAIAHRGPDGEGHWIDEIKCIGLGHRRLSIIDLSHAGNQPMHYLDRYTIIFNGEIYNYLEIKEQLLLQGYVFKSESDTEVLMANYDLKREKCLDDFDGMFALAIWDKKEQTLFCARDRFGEKPFYYYQTDESFYFASEMKALWAVNIPKITNKRMVYNYWHFDSVYNPEDLSETFYENTWLLEPSHYMIIDAKGKILKKQKYWDIDYTYQNNDISINQATKRFFELFYTSIKRRLRSDVPVGSSLSGGLDSSSIVCMIDKAKEKEINQKTFSARFPNFIKDESKYMDMVLDHVHAQGYSCYPNEEGFIDNIENIFFHQEEPIRSSSIYAQYEVMKLAKQNETVVLLDGQGADEILCGYHGLIDSFFYELKAKDKSKYAVELQAYEYVQKSNSINDLSRRLRNNKIKNIFSNTQIDGILGLKARATEIFKQSFNKDFFETGDKKQFNKRYKFGSLNEALYYSTMKGGLQELLRYCDRNSMAHSREVRLPFLSHELVTFLFSLPATFKVQSFTKFLLRNAMKDILPHEITWRKDKIGYETPQNDLLNSENFNNKLKKLLNDNSNSMFSQKQIENITHSDKKFKVLNLINL